MLGTKVVDSATKPHRCHILTTEE